MTVLYYSKASFESDEFINLCLNKYLNTNKIYTIIRSGKKPYTDEDIYFSLSHTSGMIICAVSTCEVGADVEKTRSFNEKVARKYLNINSTVTDKEFTRLWTVLESKIKYYGGLNSDSEKLKTYSYNIEDFILTVACGNDAVLLEEI